MKVVDTQWLLRAHKKALRHNYNRVLAEEAVGMLDPDGFHVLTCVLTQYVNFSGVETVRCLAHLKMIDQTGPLTYVRCLAHLKMIDQTGPLTYVLDLPPEDYNQVPEHQPEQPSTRGV